MKPVTPIIKGKDLEVVIYAKNQKEYQPFPVFRDSNGTLLSRWKVSFIERIKILIFGDIYLQIMTFNNPLQPVSLKVTPPEFE